MAPGMTHVAGRNLGRVVLYAISTCVWCRKVKRLLDDLGVDYHYVDIDTLAEDDKAEAKEEVRRWNPRCSFPTLVVNDENCVTGSDEQQIRRALGF